MRTFYIFEIKEDLKKMFVQTPYELFRTFETIYYETNEVDTSLLFLRQLIHPIAMKDLDIALFKRFKDNYFYTKYKNIHSMHDVYRKENTTLKLYKTYLKLETNVVKPRFLEELQKNHNLFLCDFEEKDYFWLDSLEPMIMG